MIIHRTVIAATAAAMLLGGMARGADQETDMTPPPQLEGPIRTFKVNDGTIAHRYLEDKGGGQDVAVWIADETKVVRGVLLCLHQGSEAFRTDYQQLARSMDFALFGTLIRWADFEKVLPDQLAQMGKALGHEEVSNVPWACLGGSRNVGALLNFARLHPDEQNQILCFLFNGGPGTGLRLDKQKPKKGEPVAEGPSDVERFATIPIMTVNGTADPFVAGMKWQLSQYPKLRKHNLPNGVCIDWGCGHAPQNGFAMWWPFVKAVYAHRVPKDADPTKGRIKLKPMRYEDGWLVGPVDWKAQWGDKAAPVKAWKGETKGTVWLPNEDCVRVWRSMVSPVEDVSVITGTPGEGVDPGPVQLVIGAERPELERILAADKPFVFHSDTKPAFATAKRNGRFWRWPAAATLGSGQHTVWAELCDAKGEQRLTRPVLIVNGEQVRWQEGRRAAEIAMQPLNIIQLDDEAKRAIEMLVARRKAADTWKLAFADDFDKGIKDAWYNYYQPDPEKDPGRKGHENDKREHVDGAMRISSDLHAVAMLPYDWPEDVAVQYRARATGDRVCDMSLVMFGHHSGSDFPWRDGMLYQFGAHFNQGSFFLVREQPHRNWQEYDSGARIKPGKWHTVRVELLGGVAKAWVDGKLRNTREISPHDMESFFGQKIGVYTFQSTVQFDDFRVYVRGASDPSKLPPMPEAKQLEPLALELSQRMAHPFAQQRRSAHRLLRENALELTPAFRSLMADGKIKNDEARQVISKLLEAVRPEPIEE